MLIHIIICAHFITEFIFIGNYHLFIGNRRYAVRILAVNATVVGLIPIWRMIYFHFYALETKHSVVEFHHTTRNGNWAVCGGRSVLKY